MSLCDQPLPWAFKKEEIEDEGVWQIIPYQGTLENNGTTVIIDM